MINNEVLLREETLHAHLRACGVNPLFLYLSVCRELPALEPFPSVEQVMGVILDELLTIRMEEARHDSQNISELMVRGDWIMSNGKIATKQIKDEITEFKVMDLLKDLRLPHTINIEKKLYGCVPQKEVW